MLPPFAFPVLRSTERSDALPGWIEEYLARGRELHIDLNENDLETTGIYSEMSLVSEISGFEHCLDAVIKCLREPRRPSFAFLLSMAKYASQLNSADTIVIVLRKERILQRLLLNLDIRAKVLVLESSLTELQSDAKTLPPNWSVLLGDVNTALDTVGLPSLALAIIDDVYWDVPEWRYFGPQRLAERLASELLPTGLLVVGGLPPDQFRSTILDAFLRSPPISMMKNALSATKAGEELKSLGMVVLQKNEDLLAGTWTMGQLLPQRSTLTHVNNANTEVRTIEDLPTSLSDSPLGIRAYEIQPVRNIEVKALKEDRYYAQGENDWYYTKNYTTLPLRIARVDDAVLGGFNVFFILTRDGQQIVDRHYVDHLCQSHVLSSDIQQYGNEIRSAGKPYKEEFQLHTNRQTGGIFLDRLVARFERPVFLLHHRWIHHFGHFVHEILPTALLWKKHLKPLNIPLISQINRPWQFDLLATIGISKEEIIELQCVGAYHCSTLYFCNSLQDQNYNFLPEMALFGRESALSTTSTPRRRKIYAARTDTPFRRIQNEAEVVKALSNEGFEIVVGSQLSVREQIRAFREARFIVGAHGSNLTNLIFGDQQTTFLELLNERFFDPFYMRLANVVGVKYDHMRFNSVNPTASPRDAEGIVDIEALLGKVRELESSLSVPLMGNASGGNII